MEYRPNDTSTVYAVTQTTFFKTTTGETLLHPFISKLRAVLDPQWNRQVIFLLLLPVKLCIYFKSASDNSFGGLFRSVIQS